MFVFISESFSYCQLISTKVQNQSVLLAIPLNTCVSVLFTFVDYTLTKQVIQEEALHLGSSLHRNIVSLPRLLAFSHRLSNYASARQRKTAMALMQHRSQVFSGTHYILDFSKFSTQRK